MTIWRNEGKGFKMIGTYQKTPLQRMFANKKPGEWGGGATSTEARGDGNDDRRNGAASKLSLAAIAIVGLLLPPAIAYPVAIRFATGYFR